MTRATSALVGFYENQFLCLEVYHPEPLQGHQKWKAGSFIPPPCGPMQALCWPLPIPTLQRAEAPTPRRGVQLQRPSLCNKPSGTGPELQPGLGSLTRAPWPVLVCRRNPDRLPQPWPGSDVNKFRMFQEAGEVRSPATLSPGGWFPTLDLVLS